MRRHMILTLFLRYMVNFYRRVISLLFKNTENARKTKKVRTSLTNLRTFGTNKKIDDFF